MKMFIFEDCCQLTDSYHSGGSMVVIARDSDHVRELLAEYESVSLTDIDWDEALTYSVGTDPFDPDAAVEPRVFIFPNAGCC